MSAIETAARLLGTRVRRNVPLGALTTYRVGGRAALMLEASTEDDLRAAQEAVSESGVPVLVLGRGSNLLVSDAGFAGLVVTLTAGFDAIEQAGPTTVRAGGAVQLPVLARRTAALGLTGFEWAVGVPGSLGGAVRMNAGGHGSEMSRVLVTASVVDRADGGHDRPIPLAELGYAYRRSAIGASEVVVAAELQLSKGDRVRSEAE